MSKREKKNLSVIITVILIFISAIIAVSYISGTENKVRNNARITIGQAREIALEDAETNEESIVFTKQKRELEKGIYAYEIEFTDGLTKYEYVINAQTGEIISRFSILLN